MKKFTYRILCGFLLGLSIFAPGVSGSVIAIIMGVYHDLLSIISNPFKQFKKNFLYCLPLGIGVLISAAMFVLLFKYLFETYEKATYLLFVGLVAGNLPVIFTEVKKHDFKRSYVPCGIIAFAIAFAFCFLGEGIGQSVSGIEHSLPWLALSGLVGGAVALIPGVSISATLMMFGVYSSLIFAAESLMHFNFEYLVPFGIFAVFAVAGLVCASRGIKFVFDKFPGLAHSAVFGFVGGSLVGILMQSLRLDDPNFYWLQGGVMLAIGLLISMLFVEMAKKMNTEG